MVATPEGLWRSGNLLVMRRGAEVPDRCIKTNQPANGKRLRAVLYWHPPLIYLLILLNLLIYALVAVIIRKKAIVYLGITEEILRQRSRLILRCWIIGIAGIVLFIAAFSAPVESASALGVLSLVLMFGGLLWGMFGARLVGVERIDEEYIWIRGVSKDYLDLLPQWNPAWQGVEWN
ncbi:hypothetical protein H6G89_07385 [Oscillatoria sp. FACHB-1407]|uniref:hypothetical protein n=1 Tax=Oscillatoria sp. FACHB-1407 TaxID=2692847 RepID=UPI001686D694|nr:hypothetical protein [Oscillatoria sp. FACHB-1407]MBD2460864.1 hypothetical protein [Oscillatoria sp. FACHB-1407]